MPDNPAYDMVIIGAGPAGLSAARTCARLGFSTLVLEKVNQPGEQAQARSTLIVPLPGIAGGETRGEGIYFAALDLLIPYSLVQGYPAYQLIVSPGGFRLQSVFSRSADFPVVAVDKADLIGLLATQARAAGAELWMGCPALELIKDGRRVVGVRTGGGVVTARVVLSTEGGSGSLCEQALLYGRNAAAGRYAVTVSQELEAPAVDEGHLASICTLGRRYTSAAQAIGTLTMPAPGRAAVSLTVYSDRPRHHTDPEVWSYLDQYVSCDQRIKGFLAGSRIISRTGQQVPVRSIPAHVVRDGFLTAGDALVPGGRLGVLGAMYLGRQAALVAAEAVEAEDSSATRLAPYDEMFARTFQRSLDAENRAVMGLLAMTDDEIDRLFQTLGRLRQTAPFFSNWHTAPWQSVQWMASRLPEAAEMDLLRRIAVGSGEAPTADMVAPPQLALPSPAVRVAALAWMAGSLGRG